MTARISIQGLPASPGQRSGRARVVLSLSDLPCVSPGEILVVVSASPELAVAFDRVAAFVTDQGGLSAHACVVAREFGIPGVVGTQVATQDIPDGSLVLVDGTAGTVVVESTLPADRASRRPTRGPDAISDKASRSASSSPDSESCGPLSRQSHLELPSE